MKTNLAIAGMTLGLLTAGSVFGQRPGSTVQLPAYSSFSVGTSVSVPDQGESYLGGVSKSQSGYSEFGVPSWPLRPLRSSALGSQRRLAGSQVSVAIHDFAALDESLLNRPTAQGRLQPAGWPTVVMGREGQSRTANRSRVLGLTPEAAGKDAPAVAIQQIRAERQQQEEARRAEAEQLFQRGASAEQLGKAGIARIYYQMAARRASGELKEKALARLDLIGTPQTESALTRGRTLTATTAGR